MANKTLPIIFLNLSGEMIYVIQQRLEAQQISSSKSNKVIQDIINTMLNEDFVEELFKPQDMYSSLALLTLFEKLVHSSIMRLNQTSMSKLYDLMLMVFKYQVVNCPCPKDLLLITLNHLDSIKNSIEMFPDLLKKVKKVHSLLMLNFKDMDYLEYAFLRNSVLNFLQDFHVRVSVLLKLHLQHETGEFVLQEDILPYNFESPGTIKKMMPNGDFELLSTFSTDETHKIMKCSSFDLDGIRNTNLGTNIYNSLLLQSPQKKEKSNLAMVVKEKIINETVSNDVMPAIEELGLLVKLMGKLNDQNNKHEITLASIDDEAEDAFSHGTLVGQDSAVIKIDATQSSKSGELYRISQEFIVDGKKSLNNDILELLDIAEETGAFKN